jgi:N-acetylglucosamine-6-phosphate deacetylase
MSNLKIINGRIITPGGILTDSILYVSDGKIVDITGSNDAMESVEEIDAEGGYISPGFVDIHLHGGGGFDFMDNDVNEYIKIADAHAGYGTTSMTPTTLTADKESLLKTLDTYEKAAAANRHGSEFLGLHLEGPYFAMSQRGAQDPRYIRNPDPDEYKDLLSRTNAVRRWSAAPELPGAIEFGKYITAKGIIAAVAHTDAIYEDVEKAFKVGYNLATHLYSAMSGVTRRNAFRYAGVIEAAYLIDEMFVELIADGVHLPVPLLKLAYKIKGPDRIALVTDAMRAAGTRVTESILGSKNNGLPVIVEDEVAKLPDRTAFAGSVATADRLVRNMHFSAGISLVDSIRMMTLTPATIMKVADRKGSLEKGKDADIVIFDENIQVKRTIVRGKTIFES